MKPVTIETVRSRLTHLEGLNSRGVGTAVPQQQFELACLRELLLRMNPRTVKLPKRSVGEVMHMSGFSRDYAEGWCAGNDNAIHEIKQMGIAVESNGCGHSSLFLVGSGVERCTLCDAGTQIIKGEQANG